MLDDNATAYSWLPSGNLTWESDSQSHTTHDSVASVELSFTGHAVSVFGTVGADNAPFSVSVDGRLKHTLLPNTRLSPPGNASHLLYTALDLALGSHTVRIQNNPSSSAANATLNIDYALVFYNANPPVPTSNHTAVVVASISAGASILLLIFLWRMYSRRRRLHARHKRERTPRPFLELTANSSRGTLSAGIIPLATSPNTPSPTSDATPLVHAPSSGGPGNLSSSTPRKYSKRRPASLIKMPKLPRRQRPLPLPLPPPDSALPPLPAALASPPTGRAGKLRSVRTGKAPLYLDSEELFWPGDQLPPPYRPADLR